VSNLLPSSYFLHLCLSVLKFAAASKPVLIALKVVVLKTWDSELFLLRCCY
jgi:hypothetical protein